MKVRNRKGIQEILDKKKGLFGKVKVAKLIKAQDKNEMNDQNQILNLDNEKNMNKILSIDSLNNSNCIQNDQQKYQLFVKDLQSDQKNVSTIKKYSQSSQYSQDSSQSQQEACNFQNVNQMPQDQDSFSNQNLQFIGDNYTDNSIIYMEKSQSQIINPAEQGQQRIQEQFSHDLQQIQYYQQRQNNLCIKQHDVNMSQYHYDDNHDFIDRYQYQVQAVKQPKQQKFIQQQSSQDVSENINIYSQKYYHNQNVGYIDLNDQSSSPVQFVNTFAQKNEQYKNGYIKYQYNDKEYQKKKYNQQNRKPFRNIQNQLNERNLEDKIIQNNINSNQPIQYFDKYNDNLSKQQKKQYLQLNQQVPNFQFEMKNERFRNQDEHQQSQIIMQQNYYNNNDQQPMKQNNQFDIKPYSKSRINQPHIQCEKFKAFIHSSSKETVERLEEYFKKHSDEWEILNNNNEKNAMNADLIWKARYNWGALKQNQWFNHHGLQTNFHHKGAFKNLLLQFENSIQSAIPAKDISPETYKLSLIDPEITQDEKEFFQSKNQGKPWVVKPINGRKGQGIYIIDDIFKLQSLIQEQKPSKKINTPKDVQSFVIQRYIANPLLLNKRKFDIRCFIYFSSFEPFVAFLYPGYIRRSIYDYDYSSYDNLLAHLVNVSLQKNDPRYEEEAFESLWLMDKFKNYLLDHQYTEEQYSNLLDQINMKVAYIAEAYYYAQKKQKSDNKNKYQIFGVDITIDDNLVPYIIEANIDPQLLNPHELIKGHQLEMLDAVFDQQVETIKNQSDLNSYYKDFNQQYLDNLKSSRKNLVLLYNSVSNFSYLDKFIKNRKKDQGSWGFFDL